MPATGEGFSDEPVRITVTRADFFRMQIEQTPRRASSWVVWALFVIGTGIYALQFRDPSASTGGDLVWLLGVVLGGTFVFVFLTAAVLLVSLLTFRHGEGVLGDRVYTFREDGIHEEFPAGNSLLRWSAVRTARRSPNFIFVVALPTMLHLFPKRCFKPQTFENLWTKLKSR